VLTGLARPGCMAPCAAAPRLACTRASRSYAAAAACAPVRGADQQGRVRVCDARLAAV
jgi:hypothetical protein